MKRSFVQPLLILPVLLLPLLSPAQQFIGLNTTEYAAIQHMATNPAYVNFSENGTEVLLFRQTAWQALMLMISKRSSSTRGSTGRQ
ncbi:MAG: hypothetical protein KDC07_06400 [Chitinophagaceae bacterium]|nr:hypothetical protein [Chitinophagaceae bacterium]